MKTNKLIFIVIFGLLFAGTIACSSKTKDNVETQNVPKKSVTRYGSVIHIDTSKIELYKQMHANPMPGVTEMIKKCNIQNYSIYLKDDLLFGYFEYTGNDFKADMAKMAEDSITQEWWKLTNPTQIPFESRKEGEWWATMEEVFHLDYFND